MKQFIKENLVLVLAFGLPILLILIVAITTYAPSWLVSTNYDFIYATCSDPKGYNYNCENYADKTYKVVGSKLVLIPIDPNIDSNQNGVKDATEGYTLRIFLHDTKKNESREITLSEAEGMTLSSLLTSPDGVTVSSGYSERSGFFIFDGGSDYGYYLMKGRSKKKLDLINQLDQYYYQGNFKFIGWVLR
jgi:hypothetical protein